MRFSIRALLLITAFVAVAVCALLNSNKLFMVMICTFTLAALISLTIYWLIQGRQTPIHVRAATCVGWIYFYLVFGLNNVDLSNSLATTELLEVTASLTQSRDAVQVPVAATPSPSDDAIGSPGPASYSGSALGYSGPGPDYDPFYRDRRAYHLGIGQCLWIWIIGFTAAVIVKMLAKDKTTVLSEAP